MNVVDAALRKAGDRGRTRDELIADTEFSLNHVRTALRKLREQGRAETDGDRWREGPGARRAVTREPSGQRFFICLPDTVDPRGPKGK